MKIFKILLLDDDINDLILIESFFQPIGGEVFFTSNVNDAFNILETANPTLCLISLELAHADNWHLLKQIKRNSVPNIGLAEHRHAFWMKEGRVYGINAYIEKPLDYSQHSLRLGLVKKWIQQLHNKTQSLNFPCRFTADKRFHNRLSNKASSRASI